MRLFTSPENIGGKYIKITDRGDIRHLSKVLRLREGDVIDVSDSVQWEYQAAVSYTHLRLPG